MEVTLFLCGDVMTGRGVDQVLAYACPPHLYESHVASALDYVALAERICGRFTRPLSPAELWGDACEPLARASPDARIVNLETSVTLCEDAQPKRINYRMHPGNVTVLTQMGIDCAVLANNHVLDWGVAGLLETVEVLERAGIRVAGAGRELATASAPAEMGTRAGARVLVFGFGLTDSGIPTTWAAGDATPGVHLLPDLSRCSVDRVAALVRVAKRPSDIAVASIHWGGNWGYRIAWGHRRFAHALIERAGVDVVHGHSSHHPRAIEVYRGRPILYGCGDLLNDYEGIAGYEEYRPDLRLLYFPVLDLTDGRLVRLTMTPLRIQGFRLRRAEPQDVAWLRMRLDRECRRFGHTVLQEDDQLVLQWQ